MPKLTHPESKQTIDASADMVEMYESQGWERSPKAKAPESKTDSE